MSQKITGTGLKFPFEVDSAGRSVYVSGQELINQSLGIILSQPTNQKPFMPEFGTQIERFRYEPNDAILQTLLREFIVDAIARWEKRIRVRNVEFETSTLPETTINCIISYQIVGSNEEGTYTYPFYRELDY